MVKRSLFWIAFLSGILFIACGETKTESTDSAAEVRQESIPQPAQGNFQNIEVRTFEVIDTIGGSSKGWGYDIVVDGKRMIRQPIIPGIQGNNAFRTEEEARRVGQLAADKMKRTGSLPTIQPAELDSLGIKY
jgi:hypothetical protein